MWQLAYTELFFLNKLWPDFQLTDLIRIIKDYKKRKKKFWSNLMSANFKNRVLTSVTLLFLLILIFNFKFIQVSSLLIIGIFSAIEFSRIIKKYIKIIILI